MVTPTGLISGRYYRNKIWQMKPLTNNQQYAISVLRSQVQHGEVFKQMKLNNGKPAYGYVKEFESHIVYVDGSVTCVYYTMEELEELGATMLENKSQRHFGLNKTGSKAKANQKSRTPPEIIKRHTKGKRLSSKEQFQKKSRSLNNRDYKASFRRSNKTGKEIQAGIQAKLGTKYLEEKVKNEKKQKLLDKLDQIFDDG